MKLMMVTRIWPTQRAGGMPFVAYDRAVQLAKECEVHVVTTSSSTIQGALSLSYTEEQEGITVHYTSSPAHDWSRPFADECVRIAKKLDPTLIHCDSYDRKNPWWVGCGVRTAVTMHGFGMGTWLTRWNEYRAGMRLDMPAFPTKDIAAEVDALSHADVVIGVSKWEWRMLRDQYSLKRAKLVYNPIPGYFFGSKRLKTGTSFLCATISQGRTRGFFTARNAAKRAGVELTILEDAVRRVEMPAIYDQSIAVVLPTAFAQGFDLTIAESRARGVPAIMTPTGSYLDEASEHDVLVDIGDEEALTGALEKFRSSPAPIDFGDLADRHRPEAHADAWLNAVL